MHGRLKSTPSISLALALCGAQCVLNLGSPLSFFALKRPDAALFEILPLDITVAGVIAAYANIPRKAALSLITYLV